MTWFSAIVVGCRLLWRLAKELVLGPLRADPPAKPRDDGPPPSMREQGPTPLVLPPPTGGEEVIRQVLALPPELPPADSPQESLLRTLLDQPRSRVVVQLAKQLPSIRDVERAMVRWDELQEQRRAAFYRQAGRVCPGPGEPSVGISPYPERVRMGRVEPHELGYVLKQDEAGELVVSPSHTPEQPHDAGRKTGAMRRLLLSRCARIVGDPFAPEESRREAQLVLDHYAQHPETESEDTDA